MRALHVIAALYTHMPEEELRKLEAMGFKLNPIQRKPKPDTDPQQTK